MHREARRKADRFTDAMFMALAMIPIGGLLLLWAGNAALSGWLGIAPEMSYGESCGVMTLLWMLRTFMYRKEAR